jgi:hypothetical protein
MATEPAASASLLTGRRQQHGPNPQRHILQKQRRAMSIRHRSVDQQTSAGGWQNAGYPATRRPERESKHSAEVSRPQRLPTGKPKRFFQRFDLSEAISRFSCSRSSGSVARSRFRCKARMSGSDFMSVMFHDDNARSGRTVAAATFAFAPGRCRDSRRCCIAPTSAYGVMIVLADCTPGEASELKTNQIRRGQNH